MQMLKHVTVIYTNETYKSINIQVNVSLVS